MNDIISDLIIRLKNASDVSKTSTLISDTKKIRTVVELLKNEGYIESFESQGEAPKKQLKITLKYDEKGTPRILGVKRRSKLSKREYLGSGDIKLVRFGRGTLVLSTPNGVMTGKQARKANIGGEALFEIW